MKARELVFNKYCGKCAFCGCDLPKGWHIAYLVPKQTVVNQLGELEVIGDNIDNFYPSCQSCNLSRIQLSYGGKTMSIEQYKDVLSKAFSYLREHSDYKKALRYGLIKETNIEFKFYFETINNN